MNSSLLLLGFVSFVTSFPQGIPSGQSSDGLDGHSGSGSKRSVETTAEMNYSDAKSPDITQANLDDILAEAENDDGLLISLPLPVITDGGFNLDRNEGKMHNIEVVNIFLDQDWDLDQAWNENCK